MGRNLFTSGNTSSKLFSRASKTEPKEVAAKKHSDAERRRRLRINHQFATLRTILLNLVKQDKASVLGETVRCFNELKETVKEIPTTPDLEDSLRLGHCNKRDMASLFQLQRQRRANVGGRSVVESSQCKGGES
ncbi:unnamed protein product [Microthlaspi erraticum]|uniref:BHLH domain-containing protein n=1 Tax=Microthlaspi erraticum TaxID=1685480 RepID=A0A6D2J3A6_9BRAS|nr:unnamed protein product [Microthlaspi erraticum]